MPTYKLTYFHARGVAETIRFVFAAAKQDYEDFRFPISFGTPGDFSTIIRKEFDDAKANGDLKASMGLVPLLEVDGVKIGQSKAIERFLATRFGFMGSSDVEAAQIDALCEAIRDAKDAYQKKRGIQDEAEKKAAMEKYFADDLPELVAKAEASLPAGSGPFLVGAKVSLADLSWFMWLASPKGFYDNTEGAKAAFQACPRIKAAMEAVEAMPEIQGWIAKRPDTMF